MGEQDTTFRNISDTALWAAEYRARETERRDALFRDPLARRLSGARGAQMADSIPRDARHAWSWVTRTVLFDRALTELVQGGIRTVVNLAAGLDTRPYRMSVPSTLRWIEVDLPDLVRYKEAILSNERPACRLERHAADLSDERARRELLARIGREDGPAAIVTEGLLIYLTREGVAALAQDLAAVPTFRHWILDIGSPGLLAMLRKSLASELDPVGARLTFAPEEGPDFFAAYGWKKASVRGLLKSAGKLGRLTPGLRILSWLPESHGRQGKRPWSGVVHLERA